MSISKKQQTVEYRYNALISELQDIIAKRYGQYNVKLIEKNIHPDSIELYFNVGSRELLTMRLDNTSSSKSE